MTPGAVAGKFLLPQPFPVDLALTVASHGWAHLAPWHWDPETGILARVEQVGGRLGTVAVAQRGLGPFIVRHDGFEAADETEIGRRVGRWLSIDWNPAEAIAALGEDGALLAQGGGRLLRCSSFYEDFVKTVVTINTAWSSTCRMAAALVADPGSGAFPSPQAVLDYGETRLRERAKLGFRAPTVIAATRRMLEDGMLDAAGEGCPDYEYLIGLKGIGPYAAAHCRVLLHDFSRIPVDSVVTAYLRERHDSEPAAFATSRSAWGAYLALGYRLARIRERLAAAID